MKLAELFDEDELGKAITDGFVRSQVHPTEPLIIYNYTEKAAYDSHWTPATLTCRGLIVNYQTQEVAARPFPKFFNYGQTGAATIGLDEAVIITDKLDGSLGIMYELPSDPGTYAIATRGSFTSEQALHATEVLHEKHPHYVPTANHTSLFEIVYPENRIVVDYSEMDDLVYLATVSIETGKVHRGDPWWLGPEADHFFTGSTFAEALEIPPRPNAEGIVVESRRTGAMLKIKQEDYVKLHRIVTGLNARTVWQWMVDGKKFEDLVAPLPDEFHEWVDDVWFGIDFEVYLANGLLRARHEVLVDSLPEGYSRKDFALAAPATADRWALFALEDGKDIRPKLLRNAKPEPATPSGKIWSEDTN